MYILLKLKILKAQTKNINGRKFEHVVSIKMFYLGLTNIFTDFTAA
jgi:hypothetical protein